MQNKDQRNNCKATAKPIIRTEYKVKEKSNTMVLRRTSSVDQQPAKPEDRGRNGILNWVDTQGWRWAWGMEGGAPEIREEVRHLWTGGLTHSLMGNRRPHWSVLPFKPLSPLILQRGWRRKASLEGDWVGKEAKECGNLLLFPLPHKPYELMIFYYRPSCIAHGDHQHGEECTLLPRIQC